MDFLSDYKNKVFSASGKDFEELALELFHFQAKNNEIYARYIQYLCLNINKINTLNKIPFLPIQFFKSHKIVSCNHQPEKIFESSGTGSGIRSKHLVPDLKLYHKSASLTFEKFYGNIQDYTFFALLPSYLERDNSSLVNMMAHFIQESKSKSSGFYLYNYENLFKNLKSSIEKDEKIFLIGVSYALIDFAKKFPIDLSQGIVMETGGMKGQTKEMPREELHEILNQHFNTKSIHSEYGMTELLSQAYSKGHGIFELPNWMKVMVREQRDPFQIIDNETTGGLNIIDLANIYSCAFIETQDLGQTYNNGSFKVLGRIDNSEIRGCNLMYS